MILNLYYYEGLTLKEIGKILEVSESRVCQLHSRSIRNLRECMKKTSLCRLIKLEVYNAYNTNINRTCFSDI